MKHFFTASITRTTTSVVLLSVLPALCIIVATGMARYNDAMYRAQESGKSFVRVVSERQNQIAETSRTMSAALAQMQEVRALNAAAVSPLFAGLLKVSPDFTNIFLTNAAGDLVASGLPTQGQLNFARQTFFKRTLRRDDFSVGQVTRCPWTGGPILEFAVPVHGGNHDKSGGLAGVVGVALNLNHYNTVLSGLELPRGARVYLLDGTGALAAAYPPPLPVPPGDMLGGEAWRSVQNASEAGGNFFVESPGQPRQYVAYQKLYLRGMDQPYFYVFFVCPEDTAYAESRALLHRDLLLFTVAVLLALVAAWGLSALAFLRPLHAILGAATSLARGDLAARVPEEKLKGEIGTLGHEFNAMAEALEKRDRELSQARDLADAGSKAKSEFLANMSHEIRTPMNAVLGMAYLVLKTDLSRQQKGYLTKLLAAANSLLRVINDILDFSKLEAGKMSMEAIGFSLRRIVSTVRSETAGRLEEKDLDFLVDISPDVPDNLIGDPLRLSQALTALVDEAISRSERGQLLLQCTLVQREESDIELQFVIRDAGIGLTPMQLAELRQLFAREEHASQSSLDGSRLSLAICHRLFRMMGGYIKVESEFGSGTVFMAVARFGHASEVGKQRRNLFEGERALVVDDGELSREALVEMLEQFGFVVTQCTVMEEALVELLRAEEQAKPYALLFADWRASQPDMWAQLARIKTKLGLNQPPAVILSTAQGRTGIADSLDKLELDAFLYKPFNISVLFDTLVNIFSLQGGAGPISLKEAGARESLDMAGVRLLVVEDNIINQQIAEEVLRSEGIEVSTAGDGAEALRLLSNPGPIPYDMVLMDLQMPEMDGYTATRAIRANPALHALALPVIAMTAHSDRKEIADCLAAGMNDHTAKPITVDKLFAAIRRWLPLQSSDAEYVRSVLAAVREEITADPSALPRQEREIMALLPYIYEGRVATLLTALAAGNDMVLLDLMDKLDAVAQAALAKSS